MHKKSSPAWLRLLLPVAYFAGLYWLEQQRPLRVPGPEPRVRGIARNVAMASLGGVVLGILQQPLVRRLSRQTKGQHKGLLQLRQLPPWLETTLALLLLDYTLYLWHVLMHRIPIFWKFHAVHHTDLEMDASTALRFHAGELLLSIGWRAAQVRLFGITPLALSLWQALLHISILFHHANLRLPASLEHRLSHWIVTPGLHTIHHSIVSAESNSNFSSGLTLWDRLHGTLNRGQNPITIGVEGQNDTEQLSLGKLLRLPFRRSPSR